MAVSPRVRVIKNSVSDTEEARYEKYIVVHDANGREMYRTYARRAKQLVSGGRAFWLDSGHTAIRLTEPDFKEENFMEVKQGNGYVVAEAAETGDETLFRLAKARVKARQELKSHIVIYIASVLVGLMWAATADSEAFLFFCMGCMLVEGGHLVAHIVKYRAKTKALKPTYTDPVEAEYRRLKMMEPERVRAEFAGFAE